MPKTKVVSESQEGKLVGTYSTGKEQHLHKTCMLEDYENFLTADDSHIMMWNLERPGKKEVYSLVDYNRNKCQSGEERILSMSASATTSTFCYTTSSGYVRICDLRESSNFSSRPSAEFSVKRQKSYGLEIFNSQICQASDAKFIPNSENFVLSRDYLSVKLWDVRTASSSSSSSMMCVDQGKSATVAPVWSAQVTDYLEKNLADLYGNG